MESLKEKSPQINSILEQKVQATGKEIFKKVKSSKSSFFDRSFWSSKLMEIAMKNEKLKVELFRFVDVLPTLKSDDQLSKHIQEYFGDVSGELAGIFKGVEGIHELPLLGSVGKIATSVAVRTGVTQMAKTFIAGESVKEVIQKVIDLRKKKMTFTIDILGEAVLSEKEASYYQNLYLDLISGLAKDAHRWENIELLDSSPYGLLPKVNVSVKLSSLYSQADPMNFNESVSILKEKLRPILQLAKRESAFIYLDMENYHFKDMTLTVFKEISEEKEFAEWKHAGIVIQAYLKDSENDLNNLIDWTKKRGVPITVRLVKGAYWDYETIISKQKRWRSPVFENKFETDTNFEKLSKLLLENYPHVYTAIGSHNIRSLAHAKAYTQELKLPKRAVEYQFLYGMADPIKEAFVDQSERVRVYTPYGELIPGMAYLVRRLLENTANESFLCQGFQENVNEEELLKRPESARRRDGETANQQIAPSPHRPIAPPFLNEPDTDFTISKNRELMKDAIEQVKRNLGEKYPQIWASTGDAEAAVNAARLAFENWGDTPVEKRIEIFFRAARIMQTKRFELAATMVLEEGKPWREADSDVSEAIDFLNYYSCEAKKLFSSEKLLSPSGEENYSIYQPRGVSVIISPWNFPLAILCGMSSASLVCGNTVILKPSKLASIIAAKYMEILEEAGLPAGVCNYLPGDGKIIGNHLVQDKDVNLIAFTGSVEVGLSINKLASEIKQDQNFVKKVICEMGGKNAIIVDDDADLDEAVKGVIYSAFGYAGQKCSAASRVIVVKEAYERFLDRLVQAAKSIKVGPSEDPASYLGPVIDKNAYENVKKYIEIGKSEGKMLTGDEIVPKEGYFISPTIFADVKVHAKIAQEEIFGPVLAVIKANDFNDAINIANGVKYALTGGLFSRSPGNIQTAKEKFKVGNLYINRACTGAKVGRQPFGGFKMSGIGSKAGGKDYLLQFVEPRVITENTMRRGFAPD